MKDMKGSVVHLIAVVNQGIPRKGETQKTGNLIGRDVRRSGGSSPDTEGGSIGGGKKKERNTGVPGIGYRQKSKSVPEQRASKMGEFQNGHRRIIEMVKDKDGTKL